MHLDFDFAKNIKTNWGEKMSISAGFEPAVPESLDIFVKTESLDVKFSIDTEYCEKFLEKLEFYLPSNKDFLLSLNGNNFKSESEIRFPNATNEHSIMIAKNIKKFVDRKNKNKFSDYAKLKTFGRDKYSSMKIDTLKQKINPQTIKKVEKLKFEEKKEAIIYRWIMRGLPDDMAIRKVKVDLEVSSNVRKKYKGKK
tara:strand:- start:22300 stop:22890 length:591 start_codon:yes stop_codon:yes gene_type:complete